MFHNIFNRYVYLPILNNKTLYCSPRNEKYNAIKMNILRINNRSISPSRPICKFIYQTQWFRSRKVTNTRFVLDCTVRPAMYISMSLSELWQNKDFFINIMYDVVSRYALHLKTTNYCTTTGRTTQSNTNESSEFDNKNCQWSVLGTWTYKMT